MTVIGLPRTRDIRVYHYLDDILVLAQSRSLLGVHRDEVLDTLSRFGWLINREKSSLCPTQGLKYLGAMISTYEGTVSLSFEKARAFKDRAASLLDVRRLSSRTCMQLIRSMMATIPMVKEAQWYACKFQSGFLAQWNSEYMDQRIVMTSPMNLRTCHSLLLTFWLIVDSDASQSWWGGTVSWTDGPGAMAILLEKEPRPTIWNSERRTEPCWPSLISSRTKAFC